MPETKPLAKSLDVQARAAFSNLVERVRQMPPAQQKRLGLLAAVAVAVVAGLIWYGTRTDWRTLYGGLDASDARTMSQQLSAAGIPYNVSPDGTKLLVPVGDLDKARLVATAGGGPASGKMGFAIFDKPNWVGSDFDERVNYLRALEGELEQTIDTIQDVRASKVNLVMPHDSLFTSEQRPAKASVVLTLRSRTISREEARSIRNLVAAAVDGLKPENVVLVSASGEDLFGARGADATQAEREQALSNQLIATLEPVAGVGNVRASVNVSYDTASSTETDETYNPNQTATLSLERSEQISGSQPVPAGIPGTTSNAPNATGAANPKKPLFPPQTTGQQQSKEESSTYGVSKQIRHVAQGPGQIKRLTVAVLLNEPYVMKGGKRVWQPRSAQQMQRLTQLAQAAVGYDAQRGDVVTVEEIPFDQSAGAAKVSWMERGEQWLRLASPVWQPAGMVLGLLLLALLVLRPMVKQLAAGAPAGVRVQAVIGDKTAEGVAETPRLEQQKAHAQAVFERVAESVNQEPGQAARLLQSWIHSE
ncbi:MAG: flagellar basal-body MS-ring/collar protein FliF [Acidobacteriaceae bacterium]